MGRRGKNQGEVEEKSGKISERTRGRDGGAGGERQGGWKGGGVW